MLKAMVAQAVASVGRRVFPPDGTLTVTAGGQSITLTGREAAAVADFALNARAIADVEYGTVRFDLTPKKVTLRVERVGQPLHLGEPTSR